MTADKSPRRSWMIERIKPFAYWDGTHVDFDRACWTSDPNNAPRFENDTSALVVMMALARFNRINGERLIEKYRIAEHEWPIAGDTSARSATEQPTNSSMCPICGRDSPHQHTGEEILRHRELERLAQTSNAPDWDAFKEAKDRLFTGTGGYITGLWEVWLAARDHYCQQRPSDEWYRRKISEAGDSEPAVIGGAHLSSTVATTDRPDVLLGETLLEYTNRNFNELCSAWSDVRDSNGDINIAKCDYAAALERCVRHAIRELATADTNALSATVPMTLPYGWSAKLVSKEPLRYELSTPFGDRVAEQESSMPNILFELVHASMTGKPALDRMVDRFLAWKLPEDFFPDGGVVFTRPAGRNSHLSWPIGTNLLTAVQARAMLEHVLTGASSARGTTNATGPRATIVPTTNAARPRPDSNACEPEVTSGGTSGVVAAPVSSTRTPTELPSNGCIALTYGKLKAALAELLRLYDWRNELGRIERDFNHDRKQMTTWLNQYGREKKTAWSVARQTLAEAPDIDTLMLHERIQGEAQARQAARVSSTRQPYQQRVEDFMLKCFGPEIAEDVVERNHRFIEEALELVQANGCTAADAHMLVDYVYGRPVGEAHQEAGGVMVTLAALCSAARLDMEQAGEDELARVHGKIDVIREKQKKKPKGSPLPQYAGRVDTNALSAMGPLVTGTEYAEKTLLIWQVIEEVQALRRGVGVSYAEGQDPVIELTNKYTGIPSKASLEQMLTKLRPTDGGNYS